MDSPPSTPPRKRGAEASVGSRCAVPAMAGTIHFFFFRHFLSREKRVKYDRFWADWFFFGPSAAWFKHQLKKNMFFTKETPKISIKKSENTSDTVKGPYKFSCPNLWDRGSTNFSRRFSLPVCRRRWCTFVVGTAHGAFAPWPQQWIALFNRD